MKISITGATGFIGKLLVKRHLDVGDDVHILTRNPQKYFEYSNQVQLHIGDLSNLESLVSFVKDADVLYHCAAEIREESIMQLINVEGTKNLIQAASGKIKHWVQLSSTGVYGPIYSGRIDEKQMLNPVNEYEKTKLESDFLVLAAAENNMFTYAMLRPSNVFGFQMSNRSIFQLVRMIDKGFYFFIGPKGASANYVPVENVIEALYLVATNPKAINQIYIISSWCSVEEFVNNIAKALGRPSPKIRFSINGIKLIAKLTAFIPKNPLTISRINALSNRVIYETSKIESELEFKPVVTVENTIKTLVQFYKNSY
jgi:nucleoside-diphosphate-sugar epimerase